MAKKVKLPKIKIIEKDGKQFLKVSVIMRPKDWKYLTNKKQ